MLERERGRRRINMKEKRGERKENEEKKNIKKLPLVLILLVEEFF